MKNIDLALSRGARVTVRLNLDRNNIWQIPRIADEFVSRGWDGHGGFSAYAAPIHAANKKTDKKSTMTSWRLAKTLTEMRETHPHTCVIRRPDEGVSAKVQQMFSKRSDPFAMFKSAYCGAHLGMYVFDPVGDIYACWERTGEPRTRIGHITDQGSVEWNEQMDRMWKSRNVTSNPICKKCRYALYCGGGCAVLALANRGEFFTNYCDGFAARFRNAVADAYRGVHPGVSPIAVEDSVCEV